MNAGDLGALKTGIDRRSLAGPSEVTLRELIADWLNLRNFQSPLEAERWADIILATLERNYPIDR